MFSLQHYADVSEAYLAGLGSWLHLGANVKRPLWASTGTKNPNYNDVLYVEELI
jgi:hypothetical protein